IIVLSRRARVTQEACHWARRVAGRILIVVYSEHLNPDRPMSTALITHRDCPRHDMGRHHPECPERLQAIEDQLIASGVIGTVVEYEAPLAERDQLTRVHAPDYVDAIAAASPVAGIVHLDPDTAMNPYSHTAALRAAGASVLATDLVLQGKARNAFCYVRPPGHHAERH